MDWAAEEARGLNAAEKASRQPSDGLHAAAITPFLNKTYDMVDDPATDLIVSWGSRSNTFIVWNVPEFGRALLPKYFKHNNFSSFVRQLNTYGFRKVDPDRWEFANEDFLRGERHLLKNIHRRKPTSHGGGAAGPSQPPSSALGPVVEVGKFGLESTIEQLQRDKNVLMMELVRLRQQQQGTERELAVMGQRLQITDQRQQQMMSFLAKAMQNPSFLAQLVQQQTETSKRLANERKRRRLPLQEEDEPAAVSEGQIVKFQRNLSNDSARAVLLQLFDDTDRSPSMDEDDGSLDDLFREMGSTAPGDDSANGAVIACRQSHVTVTEMPPRSNGLHVPLGVDDDPQTVQNLSSTSDAVDDVQNLSSAVNSSSALDSRIDGGEKERRGEFGNGSAGRAEPVDEGAEPRVNDHFWEQFLGGSSESSDVVSDKARPRDGGHPPREGESEDTGTSVQMVGSRRSVDQLAEQMGQLTPGLQT